MKTIALSVLLIFSVNVLGFCQEIHDKSETEKITREEVIDLISFETQERKDSDNNIIVVASIAFVFGMIISYIEMQVAKNL